MRWADLNDEQKEHAPEVINSESDGGMRPGMLTKKSLTQGDVFASGFNLNDSRRKRFSVFNGDSLTKDPPYTWDICFVFEHHKDSGEDVKAYIRPFRNIMKRLDSAGIETRIFTEKQHLYVLAGMKEENLRIWAEHMAIDLPLEPEDAIEFARKKRSLSLAQRTALRESQSADLPISVKEWENVHVVYKNDENLQSIYSHYPRDENLDLVLRMWNPEKKAIPKSPFNTIERIRLIHSAMVENSNKVVGGKFVGGQIVYEDMIDDSEHPLLAVFPTHDSQLIAWFDRFWLPGGKTSNLTVKTPVACVTIIYNFIRDTFNIPVQRIRLYFGERIAFYFAFLRFILQWVTIPSVLGIVAFSLQKVFGRVDFYGIEFLQLGLWLWTVIFTNYWKRHERNLIVQFGMHNHKQKEVSRPDFSGKWDISKVDGQPRYHESWRKRFQRRGGSVFVMFMFLCIIVMCTAVTMRFKMVQLRDDPENTNVSTLVGVVTAVQILIFKSIFDSMSSWLNAMENHASQESFENSMILKSFAFSFFNSFFSLFWVGVVSPSIYHNEYKASDGSGRFLDPSSDEFNQRIFTELQTQLTSLYISSFFIDNFMEVILPQLMNCCKTTGDSGKNMSPYSIQFIREPYAVAIDDMTEIIVHYAYCTLFFFVFPLTPLIAFLSIMVEARIDGFKLLHSFRRPFPYGSSGLGLWSLTLDFMSQLCLFINVYYFVYRTSRMHKLSTSAKFNYFVCTCFLLELVLIIIYLVTPVETSAVRKHLRRQSIIEESIIFQHDHSFAEVQKDKSTELQTQEEREITDIFFDRYSYIPSWGGHVKYLNFTAEDLWSMYENSDETSEDVQNYSQDSHLNRLTE